MTLAQSQAFVSLPEASNLATHLETTALLVIERHEEVQVEYPPMPYTTALLLEDATTSLGWTVVHVTEIAQALFETGLITYPRTDSTHLAPEAIQAGSDVLLQDFGPEAVGEGSAGEKVPLPSLRKPSWWQRVWNTASPEPELPPTEAEMPLEAHEAIRPTDPAKRPETLRKTLPLAEFALYSLIWTRFLASLMKPARYRVITVDLETP